MEIAIVGVASNHFGVIFNSITNEYDYWLGICFFLFFLFTIQGYFRRAETQAAAGQFDTALLSYGRALQLQPNDVNILNAAKKVAALSNQAILRKWNCRLFN